MPVVFIPILGLAALAAVFNFRWFERYGVLIAAFSVVSLAATLLAVGAGEAFREDRRHAPGAADRRPDACTTTRTRASRCGSRW